MSIRIDGKKCIGCLRCIDLCPGNLIKWKANVPQRASADADVHATDASDRGFAYIKRPRDCWGCATCVKACPSGAILYYLGADIGGTGTTMTVNEKGQFSIWTFVKPDGSRSGIVVDRTASNRY